MSSCSTGAPHPYDDAINKVNSNFRMGGYYVVAGALEPRSTLGHRARMPMLVQRDAEDAGDFFVHWEQALGLNAQVVCAPDEVAVFLDAGLPLAVIGPGATTLTPATHPSLSAFLMPGDDEGELAVCFVTTRAWEPWNVTLDSGELALSVRARDPKLLAAAAVNEVDLDEVVQRAVEEAIAQLARATGSPAELRARTESELPALVNPALAESGIEVLAVRAG
jgi:hypothetical protein